MTPSEYFAVPQNYTNCVQWAKTFLAGAGREEQAADIVHDTIVDLLSREQELRDKTAQTFIFQEIKDNCLNLIQKEARRREIETESYDEILHGMIDATYVDSPEDILIAEELEDNILASLSDLEKDIYARVLGNGVPYKDVAKELDMSVHAIEQHIYTIKKKFKDKANG